MGFIEINADEFTLNPFQFWGKDWALVTAGNEEKVNTLTVGWGGFGVLWQKKVVHIYLRPQRYTKEFVDQNERFSVTAFGTENREELTYLGKVSGREEDKISKVGFTTEFVDGVPYIPEGNVVFICKKLINVELEPKYYNNLSFDEKIYPAKDYHTLYIAEIEKILVRSEG